MTDRRLRLCLATASPNPSGVGQHMRTLAEALAGGWDVTLAAPAGSPLLGFAAAHGLGLKAIEPHDRGALHRWFGRAGFDVVHVHAGIGWEAHDLVHAARDAGGAAIVRTEHLPYLLTDPRQQGEHAEGCDAADRVVCVSRAVADSHVAAGLDPACIAVIANGADPHPATRERTAIRREMGLGDGPVLLSIARFEAQKGHDLLVAAMPAILAVHPRATLVLAGDGPLVESVARLVAARGLAASVRLLGRSDCIGDLMAAADLLVKASRFEGLPLVVLEAMAVGLPVVATAAPGTAEVIDHGRTGWLVPVGDEQALAAAVVTALDDQDARRAVTDAAQALHARAYRAGRMTDDTAALYREVAAARTDRQGEQVTRTRIGFIGAGGIAHRHLGVLEQFDDVEIVAVADPDFGRAAEAAGRVGARAFDDAEAMLAACAVDAVFICVPPFAHGPAERAVLNRGLPFFVEKPVALDLETAEAIAEEVARTGVVTAVGYHWRYLDTLDEVRDLLARSPAQLLSGYWLDSTPPPVWWWHQDRSGGQMLEQTTHLLDLARYLVGDVASVYGMAGHTTRPEFPGLDVPTVSTAALKFAGGAVANFASTCLLKWNHRVGLHLFGDGFAVELTDHDVMIDVGHGRPVRGNGSDPVWREDRDFIDAVRGHENRIRCPYPEALATLRLCLAVGESARSGEPVRFETVREPAHV